MTAFPKYPAYKDSGVAWIGDVPEHWGVYPNRRLFEERKVAVGKKAHEYKLLSLTLNGVIPRDMENPKGKFPAEFNTYSEVEPNDLVFCLFDLDETPRTVGIAPCEGMITGAYTIFKPKQEVNPKYQFYYYLSLDEQKALKPLYTGLRKTISRSTFASAKSPCPPRAEQDRIVAFLDEKTAEIDRLIAKKQRQIELLDEQKAILINRAVTRGLHPHAELQDSGIPWIGPIPKHWRVAPLYGRCEVRLGKMLDGSRITGRRLQPYLRNTDVQWFKINTDSLPMMDFSISEYERYSVRRGDLLVCEGGEPGRAAIWESDDLCFFQKALHRVRPIKGDHPRFLLYLFRNAVTQAAFSGFEKATIAHLTGEQLRRFRFAFPPPAEQKQIASHLDKVGDAFETARTKLESQIQTLQTLRSTLIAHAVTGKIAIPAATV